MTGRDTPPRPSIPISEYIAEERYEAMGADRYNPTNGGIYPKSAMRAEPEGEELFIPLRPRSLGYRFRQWLADVPIISLLLLKLCYSDSGRSVVHAEWRWKRCNGR